MVILTVNNLVKHYGPDPVLAGVTFDVRAGDHIALVGPNGCGKTTLLRILAGLSEAETGTMQQHSSARFGFLEQHPDLTSRRTVWQEAHQALESLHGLLHEAEELAEALSQADDEERARLGKRYDELHHELQRRDAYHLDHKVERVLSGLGFEPDTYQQPIEQLSGGQQNRLMLARLLLSEPELMLLDEPSNHLDLAATMWLEDYLSECRQAMILVSHDRFLLDKVASRTLELFRGTIDDYTGNYTAYRRQKAERLEVQRRTYERQQEEIAKLKEFVRRHHYGQKHAQAEDRRKKLERIELVEPPREIESPTMFFPPASRCGDVALRVEHLSKGFDKTLFEDLTFDILRGQKWAILGPNGSGKTTLLRCLLQEQVPDSGNVIFATGTKVGYFDQLLHCLDSSNEVVDSVRPDHKEFVEQQRRDLLARFGIVGDMVFQRVGQLSGGERNRTALAQLASLDANFLVLDEPTNHLDLWARTALEQALKNFDGTVLMVSHDRYFVNQVADHLLVAERETFRVVDGNYDTYLHLVSRGLAGDASPAGAAEPQGKPKPRDANSTGRRKRRFPYRKLEDIESEIADCEQTIEKLHQQLADPEVNRDWQRAQQVTSQLNEQRQRIQQLYEHWEEASELN